MDETRKIATMLAADVVGYSRLTGADEDRTLARLRALRSDLIDPTIAMHKGRVVKGNCCCRLRGEKSNPRRKRSPLRSRRADANLDSDDLGSP